MNAATHDFEETAAPTARDRLDLKAYELWTRCHADGAVPSQQELLGHEECEFVDHSVLIRIVAGDSAPAIAHIGTQLWLGLDGILPQDLSEVPARSVLSRITEHYLEAVANRTAVGFEAEFVNEDGSAIGYRAIALPCASDGETIDAVLGVVDYSLVDETTAPAGGEPAMPREGWRAVIANMRRDPGEAVADELDEAQIDEEPVEPSPDVSPPEQPVADSAARESARPPKRQALDHAPREGQDDASDGEMSIAAASMDHVRAALGRLLGIEGALAAALVDAESGMALATAGGAEGIDLDIAVAGNTEVLRAKRKAIRALGLDEQVEDIMITLSSQYHLLRPLSADPNLFLCLVLDSGEAVLAMARHALRRTERGFRA